MHHFDTPSFFIGFLGPLVEILSGDVYLCAEMYNCQEKVQHEKETGFCYQQCP